MWGSLDLIIAAAFHRGSVTFSDSCFCCTAPSVWSSVHSWKFTIILWFKGVWIKLQTWRRLTHLNGVRCVRAPYCLTYMCADKTFSASQATHKHDHSGSCYFCLSVVLLLLIWFKLNISRSKDHCRIHLLILLVCSHFAVMTLLSSCAQTENLEVASI